MLFTCYSDELSLKRQEGRLPERGLAPDTISTPLGVCPDYRNRSDELRGSSFGLSSRRGFRAYR